MAIEKVEFSFPEPEETFKIEVEGNSAEFMDEQPEIVVEKKQVREEPEMEIEVVDDTPEEDRGRKPGDPPPEVTDDELEGYSKSVRARIGHISRGYHDERRAKEAALREREEAVRVAQSLIEENRRLKGGTDQANSLLLAEAKRTAEHELANAKRLYKDAYESGDPDRVVEAQEKLTEAKLKTDKLANLRPRPLQAPENEVKPQPQPAPVVPRDERAAKWQGDNPWFGSDDEMTAFALGLHQKLVKSGVDPTSDDYYVKINSRMRKVFPEQFGEQVEEDDQPKAKAQARANVVAPATRSTAPKKIVLTQSQVSIAKRLGVSLEDYAKQVALEMRKQNG